VKGDGAKAKMPDCRGKRFALVAACFYEEIARQLVEGARQALADCGVVEIDTFEVPGCFELPLACRTLIDTDRYDALVALGAVIRGETPHFEFVAGECARGLMEVQLNTGIPIGFGVLTTEDALQAQERADLKRGNKGYDAALAAATLLRLTAGVPRAGFRS
jgi:6,7-dimethyl-8-ribityllumazine synthase